MQICEKMMVQWLSFSLAALAGEAAFVGFRDRSRLNPGEAAFVGSRHRSRLNPGSHRRSRLNPAQACKHKRCGYLCILSHLNLTNSKEISAARPVNEWRKQTTVYLELDLYEILEVVEKSQTFTPFVWTYMKWKDELLSWDPNEFCKIEKVAIPREMLWQPDLMVLECIQDHHKMFMMPYVQLYHNGTVSQGDALKVKSTCNIDVYKFPFDTQSCKLTFCSALYTDDEILIKNTSDSSWLTRRSREHLQFQGEWDVIGIDVKEGNVTMDHQRWSTLKYTITFRRRPMSIVLHFMLPLFFFLILDLCTFFISDFGAENLGFKVTLLLSISVLLLILNEILPSSSGRTPLIATYCVGTFSFLFVSLLEAILVKYLIEKDATVVEDPAESVPEPSRDPDVGCGVECTDSKLLRRAAQVLHVLRRRILTQTAAEPEKKTPWYWTRVAKRLNRAFFILYLITVVVMLVYLYVQWTA